MTPDYRKDLSHVETKKQKVEISDEEKQMLLKYAENNEIKLSLDQQTILDITNKRKTVKMITLEYNLAAKPLNKTLITNEKVQELLKELQEQDLVKCYTGADGEEYWINSVFDK